MDSNNKNQQFYRKIKPRPTTIDSNHYHHQQQIRVQQNNSNHNRSRSWFSSSNSSPSNSKSSINITKDSNDIEPQSSVNTTPTVKILAKSNKISLSTSTTNNNQESIKNSSVNSIVSDTTKTTSLLLKPRPLVAILEKNIQAALNLQPQSHHTSSIINKNIAGDKHRSETSTSNKLAKSIKIIDFEFNFIQQESSILDSWLMPDCGTNHATYVMTNANQKLTTTTTTTAAAAAAGISSYTQTITSAASNSNTQSSFGSQSFCIVAAVGMDGSGKSSLLNSIAQRDVFATRSSMAMKNRENPLSHVTYGIDLHITQERVFLLDTQPLLSASVLDELIRLNSERIGLGGGSSSSGSGIIAGGSKHFYNSLMSTQIFSSVVGFDIAETENFAFIYSIQMLTFLLTICDHVIVVLDSFTLDSNLFKLLSTAIMMVGDAVMSKANIIVYLKTTKTLNKNIEQNGLKNLSDQNQSRLEFRFKQSIQTILGPNVNVDFISNDESLLATMVLRPPHSRSLVNLDQSCSTISYQSERLWFHSIQRFWDVSIRKSSLFADYARYLP